MLHLFCYISIEYEKWWCFNTQTNNVAEYEKSGAYYEEIINDLSLFYCCENVLYFRLMFLWNATDLIKQAEKTYEILNDFHIQWKVGEDALSVMWKPCQTFQISILLQLL